ncbi:outer membrane protein assembly factor BamB family protein [Natronococcus pandeyae]|uniref:outer membrane protein assembly factor BamB family protein n=1 Tax=Natronococcus pandeyae TaxID=2055836 RepID=UPI001F1ED3B5|nr:PQQ-binding-like beta-propeller repeat protein [Natronococcus pandeyae]
MATGAALATGTALASVGAGSTNDGPALEEPEGWTSHGGTAGNTRHVPSAGGFDELTAVAWQYEHNGLAAVVDGTVYLQTSGELHALDADDGTLLWVQQEISAAGTPAVDGDAVYVGGAELTALEASTGEVRWTEAFDDGASVPAPTVAFGAVYVAVDGALYAFDAADGSLRWEREFVGVTHQPQDRNGPREFAYAFNSGYGTVAATHGTIWALLDERRNEGLAGTDALVALDPLTGETRWSDHLDTGHLGNGLTATEERLFIEDPAEEGVIVFDVTSRESVGIVSDAFVTAATDETAITRGRHGLEAIGPSISWDAAAPYVFGTPTIAGDTVVLAHDKDDSSRVDEIVGLELEDGSEKWAFEFDEKQWSDGFSVECIVDDGVVYVNRNEGLTAIRPAGDGEDDADDGNEAADDEGTETGEAADEDGEEDDEGESEETDSTADDEQSGSDSEPDDTETEEPVETDDGDGGDSVPGFTGGGALLGGAVGLEWLRRRASSKETVEK